MKEKVNLSFINNKTFCSFNSIFGLMFWYIGQFIRTFTCFQHHCCCTTYKSFIFISKASHYIVQIKLPMGGIHISNNLSSKQSQSAIFFCAHMWDYTDDLIYKVMLIHLYNNPRQFTLEQFQPFSVAIISWMADRVDGSLSLDSHHP